MDKKMNNLSAGQTEREQTAVFEEAEIKKVTGGAGEIPAPGMTCPMCGYFVPTPMARLVTGEAIVCEHCGHEVLRARK